MTGNRVAELQRPANDTPAFYEPSYGIVRLRIGVVGYSASKLLERDLSVPCESYTARHANRLHDVCAFV